MGDYDDVEWSMGDSLGKLVLRLTVGILMLFHGVSKLMNPGSMEFIQSKLVAMNLPNVIAYGVYAGEVLAPVLIILGLFSRFGGLLIAGNMVVAIALVHMGELMTIGQTGGWSLELQGFYLFCGLAIMLMGSGRFAVRPD